ncbi:MAG: hypothetical protein MUD06_14485, partial [Rhodospirillales bacterium]|nr:hypothetical protein [Rhodospirillales bacterium]
DGQPPTSKASCHPPPNDLDSEPWSYYPRGDRCHRRERAAYQVRPLESYYGGQYIVIELTSDGSERPN